jgi:uncharacterized protein YecE (DUF72 family)
MRVLTGTSGYNYDAWKGYFYPEKLAKSKMLGFYAEQLPTVEINYTFYRMPTEKTLAGWTAQVGEKFRFALKASQRITHQKRLVGAQADVDYFCQTARALGDKLGPILFQLPPNLKRDDAKLHDFLEGLPRNLEHAFEFRNASWFDERVYQLVRDAGMALCIADTDDLETPLVRTAPYGYLRLRREDYDEATIGKWAKRIAALGFERDVFVYFKHEDQALGPKFARVLAARL